MAEPQNYRNHARFDPPFHFVVAPVLLLNVFVAIGVLIHDWPVHPGLHAWLVLVSVALILLALVARASALRAQDRVIRLEELLRYRSVLAESELSVAQTLSLRQVIALRFASDAELSGLATRAATEGLTPKAIKQAIQVWRPDLHRV